MQKRCIIMKWEDNMERNIDVTLALENGHVVVYFYDNESGDHYRISDKFSPLEHHEFDKRVGDELYGWLELMADEIDEGE